MHLLVFKELLQKLKKVQQAAASRTKKKTKKAKSKKTTKLKSINKSDQQLPNRFLKFYHNNKGRLLKERKSLYHDKKRNGICVRCSKKVLVGIIFCEYHQQKQVFYNKQARQR